MSEEHDHRTQEPWTAAAVLRLFTDSADTPQAVAPEEEIPVEAVDALRRLFSPPAASSAQTQGASSTPRAAPAPTPLRLAFRRSAAVGDR